MATFRRWRRDKNFQPSHTPECLEDVKNNYDLHINRYQKANWCDTEAKEAHASVVKYLWRKEFELRKEIDNLKKQIPKKIPESETVSPLRGVHFRTTEDKTMDKLDIIKCRRKLLENMSYIEKTRPKANGDKDDDISKDLKCAIRGKSAYQISTAILAETEKNVRREKRLQKSINEPCRRGIYEIMVDRNKLGSHESTRTHANNPQHLCERICHACHDLRWNDCDHLNLVGLRMKNDRTCSCRLQNQEIIIW